MPPNFAEKTFTNMWNSQKSSPSQVSCHTVYFRLAARMRLFSRHLGPLASLFLGTHRSVIYGYDAVLTLLMSQCRNLLIHTPARPRQVIPMTSVCIGSQIKGNTQRGQQLCARSMPTARSGERKWASPCLLSWIRISEVIHLYDSNTKVLDTTCMVDMFDGSQHQSQLKLSKNHITPEKKTWTVSSTVCRTHFDQYQASSAVPMWHYSWKCRWTYVYWTLRSSREEVASFPGSPGTWICIARRAWYLLYVSMT